VATLANISNVPFFLLIPDPGLTPKLPLFPFALPDMSGRAIGEPYGMGATGVGATHRRLADQPGVLQVVETLARKLRKWKRKCNVKCRSDPGFLEAVAHR
jgi:hypothetical protein